MQSIAVQEQQKAFSRHLLRMTNPNNLSNLEIFYQALADREDDCIQPYCISDRYLPGFVLAMVRKYKKNHLTTTPDGQVVAYESVWYREGDGRFFKTYIDSIDELHKIKGALDVVIELCKYMTRAAEGSLIILNPGLRGIIAEKCGITRGRLNNIISNLVKHNVLKRVMNGMYAMNPMIIAEGYPEEVLKLRREWGYTGEIATVEPVVIRNEDSGLVSNLILAMTDKIIGETKDLTKENREELERNLMTKIREVLSEAGVELAPKKPNFEIVN